MNKLLKLFSWRNLGILRYNAIWQNLAALFYLGFTENLFSAGFLGRVGMFLLFSTLMTGYGYLVNDLADMELDRLHGKSNAFQGMPRWQAAIVVIGALLMGSLFAIPFWSRPQFWAVWLIWVLAASSYSLPPLRLKERGGWGLMTTIAAQQTLPTALLIASFGNLFSLGALCFVVYATVRGASSDVSHQMRDWANDAQTQTPTFAVRHGLPATQKLYAASLEAERLAIGLVLITLLLRLPTFTLPIISWQVNLTWPLLVIYLPLLALTVGKSWGALKDSSLAQNDPYDEARQARGRDAKGRDALHLIHHTFPSVLLPAYLALLSVLAYKPNIIFLVLLGLLYSPYLPKRWLALLIRPTKGEAHP
jgi:4-hydroxybenzoate polyprenyltransferase